MDEAIVHNLPFDDYRHGDGWSGRLSASAIKHGLVSMLQLRAYLDGDLPYKDTPAMAFGRAYHCRLLEPERFRTAYAVKPNFAADPRNVDAKGKPSTSAATSWCKGASAEWDAANAERDSLSDDQAETLEAMAAVVKGHPVINLLRQKGGAEVSVRGELLGVPVKARLDRANDDGALIVDLKKVADLSTNGIERSILNYGYHVQAALYRDLWRIVTGRWASWLWIFQQDQPPYDVRPWQPPDDDLEYGRAEYRRVLIRYKACMASGRWPGMAEDIEHLGLPEWARRQWQRSGERSDWTDG